MRTAVWVIALAAFGCGAGDTLAGIDAALGGGEGGAMTDQRCPDGQSVNGINTDGTLSCVPQSGLQTQTCAAGSVVAGIRADGSIICTEQFDGTKTCDAGQLMVGIDGTGTPVCEPISTDLVRDYVNANCYLYVGWRDSCDGCVSEPVKIGRTRGDAAGCEVAGADGSCATFSLFGQQIEMASISTDGDVNDDDKFWVGLKCE